MGNESVVGDLRLVLYEEWNVLGEEILQALTGIGGGTAAPDRIDLAQDFGHRRQGRDRDLVVSVERLQQLGQIGVFANRHAASERNRSQTLDRRRRHTGGCRHLGRLGVI